MYGGGLAVKRGCQETGEAPSVGCVDPQRCSSVRTLFNICGASTVCEDWSYMLGGIWRNTISALNNEHTLSAHCIPDKLSFCYSIESS